jgi:primosomal protein N' (replication factor Y)
MSGVAVWRVVLDMPLRRPFDYLPPTEAAGHPVIPGVRVRVPFGRRRLIGVVAEAAAHSEIPIERLRPILAVLDAEPVLDAAMLGLLLWSADYYHHPIGEVMAAALPKALRLGAPARALRERWVATAAGREALVEGALKRAPQQRRWRSVAGQLQSRSV